MHPVVQQNSVETVSRLVIGLFIVADGFIIALLNNAPEATRVRLSPFGSLNPKSKHNVSPASKEN